MANEKRLIDANALGRDAFHVMCEGEYGEPCERCVVDWDDIETAPTVDAVEVVRCKDCKHYKPRKQSAHWEQTALCCTRTAWMTFPPDGFCFYGERRTDERID